MECRRAKKLEKKSVAMANAEVFRDQDEELEAVEGEKKIYTIAKNNKQRYKKDGRSTMGV